MPNTVESSASDVKLDYMMMLGNMKTKSHFCDNISDIGALELLSEMAFRVFRSEKLIPTKVSHSFRMT